MHKVTFYSSEEASCDIKITHADGRRGEMSLTIDDQRKKFKSLFVHNEEHRYGITSCLIDVASAIHVIDRSVPWRRTESRRVDVVLPTVDPSLFSDSVVSKLQEIIWWYCGGSWSFDFTQRRKNRSHERFRREQKRLSLFPAADSNVLLWSGGLDSLAGLVRHAESSPKRHLTLFGTGSNDEALKVQQSLRKDLADLIPNVSLTLSQVRVHPRGTKKLPWSLNSALRLRGMGFLLMGAAKALAEGNNVLYVFENGVGAINLPFPGSSPGIDHSRAVHPKSLYLLSELVSLIAEDDFEIVNPFAFETKAQMCESIASGMMSKVAADSISCDSKPRMKSVTGKKVRHCGTCSSCILRRQSLAAAGIPDETLYAIHEPGYDLSDSQVTGVKAVLSQMRLFRSCIESADARSALFDAFPDLVEASLYLDGQESDIVEMYRRHVDEWFSSNLHHEYKDLVNRRIAA